MPRVKKIPLKVDIYNPLQKISVISSKGKPWKQGSIGYVVHCSPDLNYFIQSLTIVFLRHGKSGKPRCSMVRTISTLLDISELDNDDERIFNKYVLNTDRINTQVEPLLIDSKNVLDFNNLEFTAYLAAFSGYIYMLQTLKKPQNVSSITAVRTKEAMENNRYGDINVLELTATFQAISDIGKVKDGPDHFKELLDLFNQSKRRTKYLELLHMALCCIRKWVEKYHSNI